jgi:hypothetical protein
MISKLPRLIDPVNPQFWITALKCVISLKILQLSAQRKFAKSQGITKYDQRSNLPLQYMLIGN